MYSVKHFLPLYRKRDNYKQILKKSFRQSFTPPVPFQASQPRCPQNIKLLISYPTIFTQITFISMNQLCMTIVRATRSIFWWHCHGMF